MTLDLLHKGDPRSPRRLAVLEIENDSEDGPTGDYLVRLLDGERVRAGARVTGFDPTRGATALAREALGAIFRPGHGRC